MTTPIQFFQEDTKLCLSDTRISLEENKIVGVIKWPRHAKTYLQAYADSEVLSTCASAHSDQGLHCPLTESLDTTECMDREQRLG